MVFASAGTLGIKFEPLGNEGG
eukprot:SAG31_NODE_35061_length_326_cov_1.356828_1_plen_21_part_10